MPRLTQAAGEAMTNFSRRESDDGYQPVIARLAPRWRVIECRDGMQWILQHRISATETPTRADWRGRSYLRTRSGLIAACERSLPEIEPSALAILHTLPDHIEDGARPMRKSIVDQREAKAGERKGFDHGRAN